MSKDTQIIRQFETLANAIEEVIGIKKDSLDAYNIYLELLSTRQKLVDTEKIIPTLGR